ncbi:hypothetical protein [uncultured Kriegella sp.]|uniref:hypothetical protein n=1 Tax=uncultured Kriegella sp. TaxID=1798910 RepID=UPI0030DDC949|tara:strand:- start:76819 stop:77088 length:270 start_codon:yes stop_codon:yes gene_type:complete
MKYKSIGLSVLLFTLNFLIAFSQYNEQDWEERDLWMKVPELIKLAAIENGDQVADIGCHEGYFSFHLSKKVGASGKFMLLILSSTGLRS